VALSDYLRLLASGPGPASDGHDGAAPGAAPSGGGGGGGGGAKAQTGSHAVRPLARSEVVAALTAAAALESPLRGPIIEFLQAHPGAILVGPGTLEEGAPSGGGGGGSADHGWCDRVPTISFVPVAKTSAEVAAAVQVRDAVGAGRGRTGTRCTHARTLCTPRAAPLPSARPPGAHPEPRPCPRPPPARPAAMPSAAATRTLHASWRPSRPR
jgi:hypothetical protein